LTGESGRGDGGGGVNSVRGSALERAGPWSALGLHHQDRSRIIAHEVAAMKYGYGARRRAKRCFGGSRWTQVSPSLEGLEVRRLLDATMAARPDQISNQEIQQEEEEDDLGRLNGPGTTVTNPDPPGTGSTGANLNVGLSGNEPTIAVNPVNPSNIAVAQYN